MPVVVPVMFTLNTTTCKEIISLNHEVVPKLFWSMTLTRKKKQLDN